MDENESKSPWDDLAGELGAKPAAESFERKQTPATEIPPIKSESADDSYEPEQASPSDWTALAGSLGLEVEDEPDVPQEVDEPVAEADEPDDTAVEEIPEEIPTASVEDQQSDSFAPGVLDDQDFDDSLPPLPSEVDRVMSEPEWSEDEVSEETSEDDADSGEDEEADEDDDGISGEDARNAFDALFTASGSAWAAQEPESKSEKPQEERMESSELDAEISEETGEKSEGDDDEEERHPRRRRPRRRRRGRGGSKTAEGNTEAGEEENAKDDTEDGLTEEVAAPQDEEEKPRRRRSRRRSRRSSSDSDPTTDEKKRKDEPHDDLDDELSDDQDDLDDDVGSNRSGSSRSRAAHRNLPTWSEAIGCIVDANLEQRSKSPSKPNSPRGRGRGGRRRGGGKKN